MGVSDRTTAILAFLREEGYVPRIDDDGVDLTRFRGRLTRPKFGAEVAHGIKESGRSA